MCAIENSKTFVVSSRPDAAARRKMLRRGVAIANSSDASDRRVVSPFDDRSRSERMAEEVVVLARDERQLGEEDAIVLDHRLETLLSADEILELRGAEDGAKD